MLNRMAENGLIAHGARMESVGKCQCRGRILRTLHIFVFMPCGDYRRGQGNGRKPWLAPRALTLSQPLLPSDWMKILSLGGISRILWRGRLCFLNAFPWAEHLKGVTHNSPPVISCVLGPALSHDHHILSG